ncbi:MAG: riboflavin synthase [Acidimicrobiia bacterium]
MFTGIVEQMGMVADMSDNGHDKRIVLRGSGLGEMAVGASLAVNGVCLTVVDAAGDGVTLDVIPETLDRTNLGSLEPGDPVNLERAMAGSGRFDGHIVQGHIDGTGRIETVDEGNQGTVLSVVAEPGLLRHIVEKGSITVDGVSLTVASVDRDRFSVALIPHTLETTTLGLRKQGDLVNLETDVIAKYVERILEGRQ